MATIKGKWVFNEILEDFNAYYSVDGTQVNFVSNDTQYTGFSSQQSFGDDAMQQNMAYAQSGNVSIGVYSFLTSSWIVDVAYRTVDFGTTEQTAADYFLTWMQANATQIIEPPVLPTDTVTIEYNGSVIAALKAGQSATLPCKDTLMHTDVVVSVPDGMGAGEVVEEWDGSYTITNAVSLISFTVAGTSYEAEDGMTWEQWCRSTYNFDGYYVLVNMVVTQGSMASGGEQVAFNNIQVFPTDVIMEYEYQWLDYGGSN